MKMEVKANIFNWLYLKFQDEDLWESGEISENLSYDELQVVKQDFTKYKPIRKLRILLSIFYLEKRNLTAWKEVLGDILRIAMADGPSWITVLEQVMRFNPSSDSVFGESNVCTDMKWAFEDVIQEMKAGDPNGNAALPPLECQYPNRNAFEDLVGGQEVEQNQRVSEAEALQDEILWKAFSSLDITEQATPSPKLKNGVKRKLAFDSCYTANPDFQLNALTTNNRESLGNPTKMLILSGSFSGTDSLSMEITDLSEISEEDAHQTFVQYDNDSCEQRDLWTSPDRVHGNMEKCGKRDVFLWLNGKLEEQEPWDCSSISEELSADVLQEIKECFAVLDPVMKVKVMLSFFYIQERNMEEWKQVLEDILQIAMADSSSWVSLVGEIMRPYPSSRCLNVDLPSIESENTRRVFQNVTTEMNAGLSSKKGPQLLPVECQYLSTKALANLVGELEAEELQQKSPIVHFGLRKKPKSERLQEELLLKALNRVTLTKPKPSSPSMIPVRTRGMPQKMVNAKFHNTVSLDPVNKTPNRSQLKRPLNRSSPSGIPSKIPLRITPTQSKENLVIQPPKTDPILDKLKQVISKVEKNCQSRGPSADPFSRASAQAAPSAPGVKVSNSILGSRAFSRTTAGSLEGGAKLLDMSELSEMPMPIEEKKGKRRRSCDVSGNNTPRNTEGPMRAITSENSVLGRNPSATSMFRCRSFAGTSSVRKNSGAKFLDMSELSTHIEEESGPRRRSYSESYSSKSQFKMKAVTAEMCSQGGYPMSRSILGVRAGNFSGASTTSTAGGARLPDKSKQTESRDKENQQEKAIMETEENSESVDVNMEDEMEFLYSEN